MSEQTVTEAQVTLSCLPLGMRPVFQPCARLEGGLKSEPRLSGPPGQGCEGRIQDDTYRAVVNLHAQQLPSAWQMPETRETYMHVPSKVVGSQIWQAK